MKVSIIVPVFNVELYIKRCILSVMNQKYTEIECILVDDCGTDRSMDVANELIANYEGSVYFKVMHHQNNRGLSAARNTGIKEATGEYLFFLDSDDELTPNCIQSLIGISALSDNIDIICGTTDSKPYNKGYDICQFYQTPILTGNEEIRKASFAKWKAIPISAWNKLIRSEFLRNELLYFKEGMLYEDHLWWFQCARKAQKVAFSKDVTYVHYTTPNSIMSTANNEKISKNFLILLDDVLSAIDEPYMKSQLCKYSGLMLRGYTSDPKYEVFCRKFSTMLNEKGCLFLAFALTQYNWISKTWLCEYYKIFMKKALRIVQLSSK